MKNIILDTPSEKSLTLEFHLEPANVNTSTTIFILNSCSDIFPELLTIFIAMMVMMGHGQSIADILLTTYWW